MSTRRSDCGVPSSVWPVRLTSQLEFGNSLVPISFVVYHPPVQYSFRVANCAASDARIRPLRLHQQRYSGKYRNLYPSALPQIRKSAAPSSPRTRARPESIQPSHVGGEGTARREKGKGKSVSCRQQQLYQGLNGHATRTTEELEAA